MNLTKLMSYCAGTLCSDCPFYNIPGCSLANAPCEWDIDAIEKVVCGKFPPMSEEPPNSTPSAEQQTHDVILAAAYNWANGNPNAFGINGFQAGVEWAQKQQHAS